jgi:hypothetical protein
MVFPQLRQFFGAPIVLPSEFLQSEEMSVDAIIKNFSTTCMFLLFLCPGTILASSCRASCQATSSPPPLSGSVGAASSHPFSRSTTAPTPSCAADPAPSPSEPSPGTRLSPSAASRLARPWTPCLAARVTVADRRVRTQAALLQPSRSRFQTRWFLHLLLRRCHETVPEPFSNPARRFLHARDRRHHRCHRRSTVPSTGHRHRGWTSDLFSSRPRPELRGSPVDTCLNPWQRSKQLGVLQ